MFIWSLIFASYYVITLCEEYVINSLVHIGPQMCEEQCKQMKSCVSFNYNRNYLNCSLIGSSGKSSYCEIESNSNAAVQTNNGCICTRNEQHVITKSRGSTCVISDCPFSDTNYHHLVGNTSCHNALPSYCKTNGQWEIHDLGNGTWHLTGGSNGLLLVKINGEWGTVCDDQFNDTDASVACQSLGYRHGIYQSSSSNVWREGCGPIWLDDVVCTGMESSLLECSHNGLGNHNCAHQEDTALICSN